MTTTTSTYLQDIGSKHVTKGLGRIAGDAVMVRAQGSWTEFEDGRRLLDFTTGIGVTNLGHCHPKVSQAAANQCLNLVHGQVPSHGVPYNSTRLKFPSHLPVQHRVPRALPQTHREVAPGYAGPVAELIFLLELWF